MQGSGCRGWSGCFFSRYSVSGLPAGLPFIPPFPSPLPSLLLSSPHPDSPSIPGISCGESWKTKKKKKSVQSEGRQRAHSRPTCGETREVRSDQQHVFSIFHQFSFDVEHFIFFRFVCSDNFVKNFLKKKKEKLKKRQGVYLNL